MLVRCKHYPVSRFLLTVLLILVLFQTAALRQTSATIVLYLTLEELVQRADLIVIGRCEEKRSDWGVGGEKIYTYVKLAPEQCLKGNPCPSVVEIRQLGGSVGDIALSVPGTPRFHKNERVILFLSRSTAFFYQVIGLSQGKFSIFRKEGNSILFAKRDLNSVEFLKKSDNQFYIEKSNERQKEWILENFIQEIESYLGSKQ